MQAKKTQVNPDSPMSGGTGLTNEKKLAKNHQFRTVKGQQKPIEDVFGMQNYSFKNSVRFMDRNPDMINTPHVTCTCGKLIDRRKDWHVMIANGMLICSECAKCNCCMRENIVLNRRLVCIDGLVLCYSCLTNFGYFVEPPFKVTFDETIKQEKLSLLGFPENPNNADPTEDVLVQVICDTRRLVDRLDSDSSNSNYVTKSPASKKDPGKVPDFLRDCKRTDRRMYVPKKDHRRPLRPCLYDRPSVRLPDDRNPFLTAPVYDAYKGALEKMVCPVCNKAARGSARYVVPSMARIYHRKCFACKSCRTPLCEGIQIAGQHFEFCSCEPPHVWCTYKACQKQRMAHFESSNCCLGPQRPGGRLQLEIDLSGELAKTAADKKAQSMSASKTIEASKIW